MILWSKLIDIVHQVLDEVTEPHDDFSSSLDDSLHTFAQVAAPMLLMQVPAAFQMVKCLEVKETDRGHFFKRPDGLTAIRQELPDDFCRFIALNASGWMMPVNVLFADSHPSFRNQYSHIVGIGAGVSSPVAFLSTDIDAGGTLRSLIIAHALPAPADYVFSYAAVPETNTEGLVMDSRLIHALAYYTAGLYLQSVGDVNASKMANDTALELIQNINNTVAI